MENGRYFYTAELVEFLQIAYENMWKLVEMLPGAESDVDGHCAKALILEFLYVLIVVLMPLSMASSPRASVASTALKMQKADWVTECKTTPSLARSV